MRQLPVISALADEFAGRVRFVKVDVDKEEAVREAFGISSIPSYLVFKDGHEVDRIRMGSGFLLERRIRWMLDSALD